MLEAILRAGREAGFTTVEAFAEKFRRQESEGSGPALSRHEVQGDRLRVRAFRDTGDPLGAVLSAPDSRQVRLCFSELAAGSAVDRKRNFAHLLPREAAKARVSIYDPGIEQWDEEQAADLRARVREALLAFPGLRLKKFHFSRTLKKVYLANTNGFFAKYRKTHFQVLVSFLLGDHALELTESRTHFRDLDPPRLVARGANLLGALGAGGEGAAAGGEFLVMSPEASSQVLKEFSSGLRLDGGEPRGHGPAAAPRLSVLDNPLLDGQPGSAPFDDEGTAAAEKYLINKGVAVAAAADIRTAFAKGGASTGNGFRDERGIFPQVRFSNLFIKPSGDPLPRLLQQARRGVLVCLVKPRDWGRRPGERIFTAYGYAVAEGEIDRPVRFHIATSLRSYLLHVAAVSRELRFFHGRANIGSPYLLLQGRPGGDGVFLV